MKFKVLDLFSGIGGFSLGLEKTGGFETVAFCEIEEFPRKVLNKHWPNVPIYEDVRDVTAERLRADGIVPDVITGGFPCQDISVAGNQAGIGEGTRSGLWSECARLLGEIRPRYAIFENVTALLSGERGDWFKRVLWDISQVGYDAEWHCIPASELGANHHRDRVWILAYPNSHSDETDTGKAGKEGEVQGIGGEAGHSRLSRGTGHDQEILADTDSERLQGSQKPGVFREGREGWLKLTSRQFCGFDGISEIEPTICRGANGISNYAHRIKGLGNAVVPQIPQLIGMAILEAEKCN